MFVDWLITRYQPYFSAFMPRYYNTVNWCCPFWFLYVTNLSSYISCHLVRNENVRNHALLICWVFEFFAVIWHVKFSVDSWPYSNQPHLYTNLLATFWNAPQLKLNALKLIYNLGISWQYVLFVNDGEFHGNCHGHEVVNCVVSYCWCCSLLCHRLLHVDVVVL